MILQKNERKTKDGCVSGVRLGTVKGGERQGGTSEIGEVGDCEGWRETRRNQRNWGLQRGGVGVGGSWKGQGSAEGGWNRVLQRVL